MDICPSDSDVNCGTVWEVASQWLQRQMKVRRIMPSCKVSGVKTHRNLSGMWTEIWGRELAREQWRN